MKYKTKQIQKYGTEMWCINIHTEDVHHVDDCHVYFVPIYSPEIKKVPEIGEFYKSGLVTAVRIEKCTFIGGMRAQ